MQIQHIHRRALAVVAALAMLAGSGWAAADPPARVARLGYMSGAVSFSPAGENDWVKATLNRPLGPGDRLWTDADGKTRAEVQVGGAMIRMDRGTSLSVLNLDDRITQLQVTQGSLNVRVRRLDANQVFEVDTPNLAFTLRQPGEYRIDVDPQGNATTIIVRQGKGEAYGEEAAYVIDSRQPYRFTGTGLRDYQLVNAPRPDEFDRWASSRDRGQDSSRSARYVSPDVVGYQDLDAYGSWRVDPAYGNVWVPARLAVDWSPYSNGHWAWIDPWGWTWIDDAPWGFAVSHYGRWANLRGSWGWVPGPRRSRAYYAPALVAFVGGNNFQLRIASGNIGGVAWFPLAPREVYRPSYPVSQRYFENVNRSNTVINNTVINNQYNTTNVTNVVYANRQIAGAVVAVPTTAFVQAQAVGKAEHRISREAIAGRPVVFVPPVAPTEKSVRGAAAQGDKPPGRVFERPVVARTALPAAAAGFAAQREQLGAKPGHPLDNDSRKELKAAAAAPAPVVKLLAARPEGAKSTPPAPAARTDERRSPAEARREPAIAPLPGTPTPDKAAAPAKPPPALAQVPEPRGRPEADGQRGRREQPMAAPPAKQVSPASPQAVAVQPPAERGKAEADSKREQRRQPTSPLPEKPVISPVPPQAAAVQPPAERGKAEADSKREQRRQPAPPPPEKPVISPVPAQAAAVQPPAERGKAEADSKREQRRQPAAPPPEKPAAAAPPPAPPPALPKIAPRAPEATQAPESRGRGEPRNKIEPAAPPVVQPKPPLPPETPPRPAKTREQPAPAPEARGKPEQRLVGEQRGPAAVMPPPRLVEPKAAPPVAAPAVQAPPQRPAPPRETPPPQAAPRPAPPPAAPPPAQTPAPPRAAPPPAQAAPPQAAPPAGERQRGRGDQQREDDKGKRDK